MKKVWLKILSIACCIGALFSATAMAAEAEEERGIARGRCLSECFEAIARQPEAYDLIDKAAEKFLIKLRELEDEG